MISYNAMYYLITKDLKLQHSSNNKMYCVLFHPCAKVPLHIYSFDNVKIDCQLHIGDYLLNLQFIMITLVTTTYLQVLGFFLSCHVSMYYLITKDLQQIMSHHVEYIFTICDTLLPHDMSHHHHKKLNYYQLQRSTTLSTN